MESRRFVLVGQAPSLSTVGMRPLAAGATTRRLFKLMGVSKVDYKRAFVRVNLISSYMGPAPGGGDLFPRELAAASARKVVGRLRRGDVLVALGVGVASAFRFSGDVGFFRWFESGGLRCVVVPHPSGKSCWWNDADNRRTARRFFSSLAREALSAFPEGLPR